MLVLSRGRNDKVVFPSLGISVEILRIASNKVRIGIDAPDEISVLRHEIAEQEAHVNRLGGVNPASPARLSHAIRNRLHRATMGLHVLHKKVESGDAHDAETMIFKIFNELKAIEGEVDPNNGDSGAAMQDDRPCRTLLVEDDANEQELMAAYLRMSGIDVETAMDGLQAMVHLSKHERPDVVLMDMRMPRFDGRKAVAAIRDNPDYLGLKIFAVSGTEQSETHVSVGPRGVDRWFRKPVNPQRIVEAIHEEVAADCVPA
jgi:carbon storage regulator CsrA